MIKKSLLISILSSFLLISSLGGTVILADDDVPSEVASEETVQTEETIPEVEEELFTYKISYNDDSSLATVTISYGKDDASYLDLDNADEFQELADKGIISVDEEQTSDLLLVFNINKNGDYKMTVSAYNADGEAVYTKETTVQITDIKEKHRSFQEFLDTSIEELDYMLSDEYKGELTETEVTKILAIKEVMEDDSGNTSKDDYITLADLTIELTDDEQPSENIDETDDVVLVDDDQISETEINDQENIEGENSNKDITLDEFIEDTSKELDYFLSDEGKLTDSEKAQANAIKKVLNDDTSEDISDDEETIVSDSTTTIADNSNISLASDSSIYTWTVPSTIDFGSDAGTNTTISKTGTVAITSLASGYKVDVSIKGSGTNNAFTIANGSETLSYTVKNSSNTSISTGATILSASGNTASETFTYTLSIPSTACKKAGTYSGTVTYSTELEQTGSPYIGSYADIDGDGTVDGVIFADLAIDNSGKWGGDWGSWSYTAQTGLKDYYVSQESYTGNFGTAAVISPVSGTTGNDRFYVMALSDFTTSSYSIWYWYNAAHGNATNILSVVSSSANDFGSGKSNTNTVMTAWNNKTYTQNAKDIWGAIQTQVENGWFVPSKSEWAAFGSAFSITKDNRSSFGLSDYYWSSSLYNARSAYLAYFYYGYIYGSNVNRNYFVRLALTF